MICEENNINNIVNKNFKYVNEEFINYDWKLERNEINNIMVNSFL